MENSRQCVVIQQTDETEYTKLRQISTVGSMIDCGTVRIGVVWRLTDDTHATSLNRGAAYLPTAVVANSVADTGTLTQMPSIW
jgi:hypothetical protein